MRLLALIFCLMSLVACGQEEADVPDTSVALRDVVLPPAAPPKPQTLEDIDFSSYSSDLAKFTGLERGEARIDAVDKVRLYFAPQGAEIVKTSTKTFDRDDGSVMIFSVSGLKDDSVKAQEIFLILEGQGYDQTLAEYGMRIKCHRGNNTTNWQTELCP